MFGSQHLFVRFALASSVILANCSLVTAAGQTTATPLAADCSAYSSVPLPSEAEKAPVPKAAPNCASYRSYRGIGRPVNYTEARACAWQERLAQKAEMAQNSDEPLAWVVGGSLILADIYFNGAGVKRDVPLAMRFACEAEEGMAMIALPEIEKLNGSPGAHRDLEFCDYAVTTFSMNFCSGYKSQIEDDRRSRYYTSLKSSMTSEQQAAFDKLLATHDDYINAHASEVYQGGTIRVMRTIGSQTILKELFRTALGRFERKKWPRSLALKSQTPMLCCVANAKTRSANCDHNQRTTWMTVPSQPTNSPTCSEPGRHTARPGRLSRVSAILRPRLPSAPKSSWTDTG